MSVPTTTPSLTLEDFFSTTLSADINASTTVIPVNAVPSSAEGFLVLDQDNGTREIIYYTSKGASTVTCPSAAAGRGQGGTTAASHSSGATVKMNMVSQLWKELQNGNAFAVGIPVQIASYITGASATGTTVIPNDDTIPQSTEGDQYLSLAFTPKSATNRLFIEVKLQTSHSSSTIDLVAALFQDSGTSAIAGGWVTQGSTTFKNIIMIGHDMVAGTTTATTFKVRAGANGAGTLTVNGSGGGRILGGVLTSYIKITEYKAV